MTQEVYDLSVVVPCLDEEQTLERCIRHIQEGVKKSGLHAEIVIADNGSKDRSIEIATSLGARVVHVKEKGYGAALDGGIRAALGKIVVFADADLSYPFENLDALVLPVHRGEAEFVLGTRLDLPHEKGAMPTLNRFVGTPILSFLIRAFFSIPSYDCNSGMRAFLRKDYERLGLCSTGMEYASEMLIRVAQEKLTYQEVPIQFRKDARGRPPHLRRWRDGWRHLRFILANAPTAKVIAVLSLVSFFMILYALRISIFSITNPGEPLPFHTALALLSISGPLLLTVVTFVLVKISLETYTGRASLLTEKLEKYCKNGAPFYWSIFFFILAFAEFIYVFLVWFESGFGELNQLSSMIRMLAFSLLGSILFTLDMGYGLLSLITKRK